MKKLSIQTYHIIIAVLLLFSVSSCNKLLDEEPVDRLATTNFYKTEADANAAVNAIYNPIRGQYGSTEYGKFSACSVI